MIVISFSKRYQCYLSPKSLVVVGGWVVSTNYRVNLQVQTWDLRMSIYWPFLCPKSLLGGWWWDLPIIESISRSRPETWEWLWVSIDLLVIWSWPGHGLDLELDNMKIQLFVKDILPHHHLMMLNMNTIYWKIKPTHILQWNQSLETAVFAKFPPKFR